MQSIDDNYLSPVKSIDSVDFIEENLWNLMSYTGEKTINPLVNKKLPTHFSNVYKTCLTYSENN